MKKLRVFSLVGCVCGFIALLLLLCGCTITKGAKGDLTFSLMQMQTAKYAASAMSTTGVGMEIEMTGQSNPFPKIRLGYFRHGTMLVPSIKNGYYMPFVIIDTGVNPFNKDGVTDTIQVGGEKDGHTDKQLGVNPRGYFPGSNYGPGKAVEGLEKEDQRGAGVHRND